MVNNVETLPGAAAAAHQGGANGIGGTGSAATGAAPDSVAPGPAAIVALAYLPATLLARSSVSGAARDAAEQAEGGAAASSPPGPELALIRAALPSGAQGQFEAQLAAASAAWGRMPETDGGNGLLAKSDLAKLLAGDAQDATMSATISRLAHAVAHFGAADVAAALQLTHARIAYAFAGTGPQAPAGEVRVDRREAEREREQQRRALNAKRDTPDKKPAVPEPSAGSRIADVVCYGGATVAMHSTLAASLFDERNDE